MMRLMAIVLILCAPATAGKQQRACAPPVWTVNLAETYSFRSFGIENLGDAPHPQGWAESRGVTFLSPHLIAIYQVLPSSEPPTLTDRLGDGKIRPFVLQIQVLASSDGKPVKSLQFTTGLHANRFSAKLEWAFLFPSILPTHDGRFLVRTKDMLRLFSADFVEIACKELASNREATSEEWKFSVSPRGDQVYAEHSEDFFSKNEPGLGHFKLTRYLFDADTLKTLRSWDYRERPWGAPWERSKYKTEGGGRGKGPNEIVVLPDQTHPGFTVTLRGKDRSRSEVLTDALLAVEIHHYRADPFDVGRCSNPVRLAIYDLASKSEKCSIPIAKEAGRCGSGFLYGVSSTGAVAVIQGTKLSLYRPYRP
jgi:hypothetical protein